MNLVRLATDFINDKIMDDRVPADIRETLQEVITRIPIKASNRLTRAAGHVKWSRNCADGALANIVLQLSIPLLSRVSEEEAINVCAHEVAHAVQLLQQGTSDHGARWKAIHRALGGDAKVYHNIDRTGLHKTVKRWEYIHKPTGTLCRFTKKNHQRAMFLHDYEFKAEVHYKGNQEVARYEAQYALAACRSK